MPDDTTKPDKLSTTVTCPRCQKPVDTKQQGAHRVLRLHGPSGQPFCRHSGGPVPK